MLKTILSVAVIFAGLTASAMAAPMAGPEVEFYPGQLSSEQHRIDAAEAAKINAVRGDALDLDSIDLAAASDADLGKSRGGIQIELGDVQVNEATNTANANNNTVNNSTTGQVADTNINDVSGFTTMMNNTGNNVIMQSITEVNVILN